MEKGYGEDIPYSRVVESTDPSYKKSIWDAAIGLQAVDGLEVSSYLRSLSEENISGKKSYDEIKSDLSREYGERSSSKKEADMVAVRIAEILEIGGFSMLPVTLVSIHRRLFEGVFEDGMAGCFRTYNITKKENILFGDTVRYGDWQSVSDSLKYLIDGEKGYRYSSPMTEEDIAHLSEFTKDIWQVHPFGEGNTRTVAVFIELYMRSMGFAIDNEPFADNSLFFRNALVRASYSASESGIYPNMNFLIHFYKNVFLGEKYILDNFDLFISNKTDSNYEAD